MLRSTTTRIIAVLLLSVLAPTAVFSQSAATDPIQPDLDLIFVNEEPDLTDAQQRAATVVFSAVEAAFRAQRRYDLNRATPGTDPESLDHPAAVVSVTLRRDGTLGVESDVWDGDTFAASEVFDLPTDQARFAAAEEVAVTVTGQVADLFPGFGRVRFSNSGARVPYYVYADGTFLGANLDEIDLPVGDYDLEVRRRDDAFEQVAGRVSLSVRADDFVEVTFSMDRQPPPIPGYLRLMNPEDRWKAILDVRGSYLIPVAGLDVLETEVSIGSFATALFNDVGVRGLVLGLEAGQVYVSGRDNAAGVDVELSATPAMGVLGISVGPVSGVDFLVRAGAGMALTGSDVTYDTGTAATDTLSFDGHAPVFNGTMEFGFGVWRNSRLSLHTSWIGLIEGDSVYSWIGVGLGLGGRF